jgi:hypothetical protein
VDSERPAASRRDDNQTFVENMKIIALIMLSVFALDLLAASYLMHSWIAGVLLPLTFVALFLLWPGRRAGSPDEIGWCLGPAIELSNPDRPERIEKAYIAPKILNLGLLFIGGHGAGKTESATLGFIKAMREHSPGCGWVYFEGKTESATRCGPPVAGFPAGLRRKFRGRSGRRCSGRVQTCVSLS